MPSGAILRGRCHGACSGRIGRWLAALERRGYVTLTERVPDRDGRRETFRLPVLTASQEAALASVGRQFADRETVLLYGVTGSGKTEIYMHLIARTLLRGEDVLLLVPEIVLTSQLVERMERTFGDRVTVYHSRLTDRRRTETYLRLCRSEGGELVLGARSSLFLPLKKLGLVVVDEEHDPSYKQAEPAPRYHARDCAVVAAACWEPARCSAARPRRSRAGSTPGPGSTVLCGSTSGTGMPDLPKSAFPIRSGP